MERGLSQWRGASLHGGGASLHGEGRHSGLWGVVLGLWGVVLGWMVLCGVVWGCVGVV